MTHPPDDLTDHPILRPHEWIGKEATDNARRFILALMEAPGYAMTKEETKEMVGFTTKDFQWAQKRAHRAGLTTWDRSLRKYRLTTMGYKVGGILMQKVSPDA